MLLALSLRHFSEDHFSCSHVYPANSFHESWLPNHLNFYALHKNMYVNCLPGDLLANKQLKILNQNQLPMYQESLFGE